MFGLIAAALLLQQGPQDPIPSGIFNGKTLEGWTKVGGGEWAVADGAIIGRSKPGQPQGLLIYKHPVKDFVLTMKFKISAGDSGLYFRVNLTDKDPFCEGFQVEIDTSPETGGIYETNGRGWVAFPDAKLHETSKYKAGEWANLTVTARSDHYVVSVNGTTITDVRDPQGRREGRLALQLHGDMEMDVMFKEIVLGPMPPETTP
jgi:hypothetical protein